MFRLTAMSIGSLSTAILIGVLTVYLIAIPDKPRALRHLIWYFASVALLGATYFVRYSFLTEAVVPVSYLSDLVVLGVANFVWFAFHFPSNDFPRLGRVTCWSFTLLAALAYLSRFLQPQEFGYQFYSHYLAIPSNSLVGVVIALGYTLTGSVLLVKAWHYSRVGGIDNRSRAARSFAIQAFMSLAISLTFVLLSMGLIGRAEYQTTFNFGSLIITMAIFVSYINYSPVPVSVRVKLSGVILAVVLIVTGFAGTFSLLLADDMYYRDNLTAAQQSVSRDPPTSDDGAYIARVAGRRSDTTADYQVLDAGAHTIRADKLHDSDRTMAEITRNLFGYELPDPPENSHDYRLISVSDFESYFTTYRVRAGGALYEIGLPYGEFRDYTHQFGLVFLWVTIAGTVLVLVLVPRFFRSSVLRPLRELLTGVEKMDNGQLDVTVPVRAQDELGRLSGSFNQMVASIRHSTRERERLNAAYKRFVPADLLTLLGKDSILDVQLGDQIMRTMAVMFTDIRSFTSLSEGMSPDENFRFLNEYLGHVAPVINRHKGYIDKYLGDGILSVFPESPMSAVQAAIALQNAVADLNAERARAGEAAIAVGCGIHSGAVMLGTIGAAERMDGTVIADSVNVASRIEGLNKTLGTSILVTEAVAQRLEGIALRRLGQVQVVGKSQAVELSEIPYGPTAKARLASAVEFDTALEAFSSGDLPRARQLFEKIVAADPNDIPATYYASYCAAVVESQASQVQPGVLEIRTK